MAFSTKPSAHPVCSPKHYRLTIFLCFLPNSLYVHYTLMLSPSLLPIFLELFPQEYPERASLCFFIAAQYSISWTDYIYLTSLY